jgi:hypothetical protein
MTDVRFIITTLSFKLNKVLLQDVTYLIVQQTIFCYVLTITIDHLDRFP